METSVQEKSAKPAGTDPETSQRKKKSIVISLFGYKGSGKTYNTIGICKKEQKILLISFDGVSQIIAEEFYSDYSITFYDAIKHNRFILVDSPEGAYYVESVENEYKNMDEMGKYLNSLAPGQFDVIIFDGLNFAEKMAEGYMRYKKGLKFDEKFADLNYWKIRNSQLNGIVEKAREKAGEFVIFTVYVKEQVMKKENGEVLSSIELPNYAKEIESLAVVEIRIDAKEVSVKSSAGNSSTTRFFATVKSSKIKRIPTGTVVDITGKRLRDVFDI